MARLFGWLAPDGELIRCPFANHMEVIREHPKIQKITAISDLFAQLEDVREGCEELIKLGEHPEWHNYEILNDDLQPRIYREMLKNKYLRVGEVDNTLVFEGLPNVIKARMSACKELAREHRKDYRFEPIR